MEKKNLQTINPELYSDITKYANLNNLEVDDIINTALTKGFNIERYGLLSKESNNKVIELQNRINKLEEELSQKPKEVIKEVIKEKPVYVDKEVIVEKEVFVDKEPPTENNDKIKQLQDTIRNLTLDLKEKKDKIKELEKTVKELTEIGGTRAEYMRSSNLKDDLYR